MKRARNPISEPLDVTRFVEAVGRRVRLLRLARNITQADMAARSDMARSTLSAIEGGALSTRFADVARVLWALDDQSLQRALSDVDSDPEYREASEKSMRQAARSKSA